MSEFVFEWAPYKNASNKEKHGISFEDAKTVFTDHSDNEDRFVLLGTSIHSRLLVVCHCIRNNDSIRIISARKADKKERNIYEGFRHA